MTTAATTPIGQREEEARRIAREEGFPIINPSPDWTSFDLMDDQETEDMGIIRTTFIWESFRFEGHVYTVGYKF